MEGQGYDLYNKLIIDDPTFKENGVSTSYQAMGNVHDAPPTGMQDINESEEPPPRATEVASVVSDKQKPVPPPVSEPPGKPKPDPSEIIQPATMPGLEVIPTDLIPEQFQTEEVLREANPEIILANGKYAPCEASGSSQDWKDCMTDLYMQLSILLEQQDAAQGITTPQRPLGCMGGRTEGEGEDCALHDLMVGKAQGFVAGYGFGVKQLVHTYLKAYRHGYLQAYDKAYVEGREKYLGEVAAGTAQEGLAESAKEKMAGLSGPHTGGSTGAAPIKDDQESPDETSAKKEQDAQSQQTSEEKRAQEELKSDYAANDEKRKKEACERKKKERNEKENSLDTSDSGPSRTPWQKSDDDNAPCETGPGVSAQP